MPAVPATILMSDLCEADLCKDNLCDADFCEANLCEAGLWRGFMKFILHAALMPNLPHHS